MNEKTSTSFSPSELILARSEAFSHGDFGFIFDSYHSESNFRRQFVERDEYLEFGKMSLGQDYQITSCQVLDSLVTDAEAQVVFLMEMTVHGNIQQFAELAWLQQENDAWCYHRGQKITHDELPENPKSLRIADFSKRDPSTIF